jgi:hypothetical protein
MGRKSISNHHPIVFGRRERAVKRSKSFFSCEMGGDVEGKLGFRSNLPKSLELLGLSVRELDFEEEPGPGVGLEEEMVSHRVG